MNRNRLHTRREFLGAAVTVSLTCWICANRVEAGSHSPQNLIAPPESETETSVTLLWDPPSDSYLGAPAGLSRVWPVDGTE